MIWNHCIMNYKYSILAYFADERGCRKKVLKFDSRFAAMSIAGAACLPYRPLGSIEKNPAIPVSSLPTKNPRDFPGDFFETIISFLLLLPFPFLR